MAIMRRFIGKKHKELKGFVPVMVGEDEGMTERFLIPTHFLSHPPIISLLQSSVDEFGYSQQGVLHISHHPDCFREILQSLSSKKI